MKSPIKTTGEKSPAQGNDSLSETRRLKSSRAPHSTHDHIMFLQRTIGNQAVERLFESGAIQAKLRIGQPGDVYEQEADRVADAVMRMPEPPHIRRQEEEEEEEELIQTKTAQEKITPLVQRQAEEEEEEEEEDLLQTKLSLETPAFFLQRQTEGEEDALQPKLETRGEDFLQRQVEEEGEEEEELVQPKQVSSRTPRAPSSLESHLRALRGGGQPIPESLRAYYESRFGYDFSSVRLHTNSPAARLAKALNARAFTIDKDVALGEGQYAPDTATGRRLLAHELTHVIQQKGNTDKERVGPAGTIANNTIQRETSAPIKDTGEVILQPSDQIIASRPFSKSVMRKGAEEAKTETPASAEEERGLSAGSFTSSSVPASLRSFTYRDVAFSHCRSEPGPLPRTRSRSQIICLTASTQFKTSYAYFELEFDYDGYSILDARTEIRSIEGFDGKVLGSTGSIDFFATEYAGSDEEVLAVLLTFSGSLNAAGRGSCELTGSLIVRADGTVEPLEANVTGEYEISAMTGKPDKAGAKRSYGGYHLGWFYASEHHQTEREKEPVRAPEEKKERGRFVGLKGQRVWTVSSIKGDVLVEPPPGLKKTEVFREAPRFFRLGAGDEIIPGTVLILRPKSRLSLRHEGAQINLSGGKKGRRFALPLLFNTPQASFGTKLLGRLLALLSRLLSDGAEFDQERVSNAIAGVRG